MADDGETVGRPEPGATRRQEEAEPAEPAALRRCEEMLPQMEEAPRAAGDDLRCQAPEQAADLSEAVNRLEEEMAGRRRAEADLARSLRIVSALSRVSTRMQAGLDIHSVVEILRAGLELDNLVGLALLLDAKTASLTVHRASIPLDSIARYESLAGHPLERLVFPAEVWPLSEVLAQGKATFVAEQWPVLLASFPGTPPHRLEADARALGIAPEHPAIYARLATAEQTLGVLVILGADLREQDLPAFSLLADQLAGALERLSLGHRAGEVEILREVNLLRSQLIANVSHEIRTPLGMIDVLCTSLLAGDVTLDPETQRSFLVGIKEATDRLATIVENLLRLSRSESGRLLLHKRPTDLAQVAASVLDRTKAQSPRHRMVLKAPDLYYVALIDPQQMELVLTNLLNNAVKYSPQGGEVVVELAWQGADLVLSVSDQGIGIPEEEQERIFERFYRVDNATSRQAGGAGLGLAVCRSIAEAHGGKIWVVSRPGEGSTFHVSVPISPPEGPGGHA